MSEHHSPAEFQKHLLRYKLVFGALIVGTIITVAASYLKIDSVAVTVAIALFIATVKGFLVAGWFMHLISEKKMIYGILVATAFFAVALMFLIIWSMNHSSLVQLPAAQ